MCLYDEEPFVVEVIENLRKVFVCCCFGLFLHSLFPYSTTVDLPLQGHYTPVTHFQSLSSLLYHRCCLSLSLFSHTSGSPHRFLPPLGTLQSQYRMRFIQNAAAISGHFHCQPLYSQLVKTFVCVLLCAVSLCALLCSTFSPTHIIVLLSLSHILYVDMP